MPKPSVSYAPINLYFDRINNFERKCRKCQKVVKTSGNTTNLRQHLKNKHQVLFEALKASEAKNSEEDIDDPPPSDEQGTATKRSRPGPSFADISGPSTSSTGSNSTTTPQTSTTNITPQNRQPLISHTIEVRNSYEAGGTRNAELTDALLFMIAKDCDPLHKSEKEGFRYFCNKAVPLYKIPSRSKITYLMDQKYSTLKAEVCQQLQKVSNICLTADIWTETLNTRSFLAITSHFLEGNKIDSVLLDTKEIPESHTADNIKESIRASINDWKITLNKISAVVTDGASNIKKGVKDLVSPEKHLWCCAHLLNLVAEGSIGANAELQQVIKNISYIVTFFKQSLAAANALRLAQVQQGIRVPLKLIQSVDTRWNSKYYMTERFLKLVEHVNSVLLNHPSGPQTVSREDIRLLRDFERCFKPLEEVTRDFCGENYVTASRVIPIIWCLKKDLRGLQLNTQQGQTMRASIQDELEREDRFGAVEFIQIFQIATILDPRFKNQVSEEPRAVAAAVTKITQLTQSKEMENRNERANENNDVLPPSASSSVWRHHDELMQKLGGQGSGLINGMHKELRKYLDEQLQPRKSNPLEYWINNKSIYPALFEVALKYLSIMATSAPSERNFSTAGNIITENRNRLCPERWPKLLFLNSMSIEQWKR